ncbi:MAG: class I SAM-dependent methyltransferase [Moorea sp. SIO2B7]|nr:class I SAM-dependent methyltransferase [Moorena sp. SIO2B7]
MKLSQNDIWNGFVKLIKETTPIREVDDSIDWQAERERLSNHNVVYPNYYKYINNHGVKGGYRSSDAVLMYDPFSQYVLSPEKWIREELIATIDYKPQNILDLGCGTGSTTVMLKQAFHDAKITGLDVSTYMLSIANYKAKKENLDIQWVHGLAETTEFDDAEFDLVTASLLFHEIPTSVSQSILKECYRLLTPGGKVFILDVNQKTFDYMPIYESWMIQFYEEPYLRDYGRSSTDAWMGTAGFNKVSTDHVWWIYQVTRGIKN